MKNLKKLLILLLTITMILPFSVGCGDNSDNCNHENVIVCDTCGEIVVGEEYFSNMVKFGLNSFGKNKSMKTEMNGSLEMNMPTEAIVEYEDINGDYKIIETPKISFSFETVVTTGFDAHGGLIASGNASMIAKQMTADGNTAKQISYSFSNVSIENLKFKYTMKEETTYPTLSEDEKAINDYSNEVSETIDLSNEETPIVLTQMLPRVLEAYSDPIVPYISGIVDVNKKDINSALANAFDSACTLSKKDGNNVFTVTKIGSGIKKIPLLLESKVNVLVNETFGEGSYEKIPEEIEKLLNVKLSTLLSELEKKGIKIGELSEVIDETIQIVMDDETASLEKLTGVNIVGFIDNLDKEKSIKEILINYGVFTEQTLEEFLTQLETTLNEYKDMTGYDIINQLFNVNVTTEQKATIIEASTVIADFIDKTLNASVVADSKGNISSVEYGFDFNGTDKETKALIDWIKATVSDGISEDEEVFNLAMTALSSAKATISYKTSVVK